MSLEKLKVVTDWLQLHITSSDSVLSDNSWCNDGSEYHTECRERLESENEAYKKALNILTESENKTNDKHNVRCCKNYEDFKHDLKVGIENTLMKLFWSGAIGMDSLELLKLEAIKDVQKSLDKYIE